MQTTSIQPRQTRHGLSIIEVLTSIVVAMIGVFGVMILIPFGAKQAELGLDRDVSTTMGKNAIQQFRTEGFNVVNGNESRWLTSAATSVDPFAEPQIISIDPLYVNESGGAGWFPGEIDDTGQYTDPVTSIPMLTLARAMPDGDTSTFTPINLGEARRLFRAGDDLVFGEPLDDLDPPQQVFDTNTAGGTNLARQARGEMSWSALMVPTKDNNLIGDAINVAASGTAYRMFVLIHKNRVFNNGSIHQVEYPRAHTTQEGLAYNGGFIQLEAAFDIPSVFPPNFNPVNKDDWVMMINEIEDPYPIGADDYDAAFQKQIAFYRVVAYDPNTATITLDGPDFNLGDRTPAPPAPSPPPADENWVSHMRMGGTSHTADLILLKGYDLTTKKFSPVVNVVERTIRWEQSSSWNQ